MAVHTDTACLDRRPTYYREPDGRIGRFMFLGYREVRATMLANGDDKPIWMTEFGWSAAQHTCEFGACAGKKPAGVTEAEQAKFLLEAMNCLEADPYVRSRCGSTTATSSGDGKMANMYGLRRFDGSQRPAYDAFRTWAAGGGRSSAPCGDFGGPDVQILAAATGAVLPPGSPLYIRAKSGARDLRRIRFRVPGTASSPTACERSRPSRAARARSRGARPSSCRSARTRSRSWRSTRPATAARPPRSSSRRSAPTPPAASGMAAQFPTVRLGGSGQSRTFAGGPLPGVLGGALRIESGPSASAASGASGSACHAQTKSARSPWIVRQRLRFRGMARPPGLPRQAAAQADAVVLDVFQHRKRAGSVQCPRGTVPFPSRRR